MSTCLLKILQNKVSLATDLRSSRDGHSRSLSIFVIEPFSCEFSLATNLAAFFCTRSSDCF